jgi:hypothetical protein
MDKKIEGKLNIRKKVEKDKAHKKELAHYSKNWKYELLEEECDGLTFDDDQDFDEKI